MQEINRLRAELVRGFSGLRKRRVAPGTVLGRSRLLFLGPWSGGFSSDVLRAPKALKAFNANAPELSHPVNIDTVDGESMPRAESVG